MHAVGLRVGRDCAVVVQSCGRLLVRPGVRGRASAAKHLLAILSLENSSGGNKTVSFVHWLGKSCT